MFPLGDNLLSNLVEYFLTNCQCCFFGVKFNELSLPTTVIRFLDLNQLKCFALGKFELIKITRCINIIA